jgi:hypothetical protein
VNKELLIKFYRSKAILLHQISPATFMHRRNGEKVEHFTHFPLMDVRFMMMFLFDGEST